LFRIKPHDSLVVSLSSRSTDYAVVVDKLASVDVLFLTPR